MDQDQFLNIDTPENVIFDYEVAGIGSRFLAAMVDSILIAIGMVVVNFTGLLLMTILGLNETTVGPSVILAILGLVAFLFFWGYYIFFEIVWNGQSPGKRWLHLRVLRIDGTPIAAREALIRNLARSRSNQLFWINCIGQKPLFHFGECFGFAQPLREIDCRFVIVNNRNLTTAP